MVKGNENSELEYLRENQDAQSLNYQPESELPAAEEGQALPTE